MREEEEKAYWVENVRVVKEILTKYGLGNMT